MKKELRVNVSMQELDAIMVQTVKSGGTVELTVTGCSMLPLLLDRRSTVRLRRKEHYALGDIVLFRRNNGDYVLHRVCRIHDGLYDILGDNVPAPDCDIHPEQMIAAVCAYSRKGDGHWHSGDRVYRCFLPLIRRAVSFARWVSRKLRSIL